MDLKHEGESDEVIYQYTGEGSPTPNKYALDEIYPEKFDDAAGQPSKTLFAKNARMRMVEYFPEKDIKAYLGGEADELMFGHSVSGYGMANDQYEVREVPDLIPQQFMSAAGLTSKELQRNVLKEKINQDGPDTKTHVADRADEVMYGRRTNRHPQRRHKLQDMPIHGFGGGYRDAAGMASAECVQAGEEPLELKLEGKIQKETPPYLGGEADEVIYGRQMGGNRSELNEIRDLKPEKFSGAAGLTSNEVIRANPDLEHYIIEQPPGSLDKIELRRGGEMAERLGSVDGVLGDPLKICSTYPEKFLGAAGMNSNDCTTKNGSAEQMIFRINPQSGLNTGGEAAQAIYGQDIGHSFVHKGNFEISSVYPRAYRGVAGASSRNLFKNSPEAGGRHLFSENLKDRVIGKVGAGTDAKPFNRPGSAGLNSKMLFKGHKLQAIGDTPRERNHDTDGDGVFDHLRDEEADIVLYGCDLPDSELRKVGGIKDKNPKAFEGAAGLTSREVFRVQQEVMSTPDANPDEHKLGQARYGGEMDSTLYGESHAAERPIEWEVQKLAPGAYRDAAGLTSRVAQQVMNEGGNLDDARGKKTMPPTQRAKGNPNDHTRIDLTEFAPDAYVHTAGLSSVQQHKQEDEENIEERYKNKEVVRDGGEAAATVFGGRMMPEKTKHKSIAGLTSTQIRSIKRSGFEARRIDVRTMKDGGGSEAHDTMYGKSEQDVVYDGNEESRIHELPEIYPESFSGAAGLASKEVFRQFAKPHMFGEKTMDGLEYGAKHIADLAAPPNAAQLNQAFMQTSHWFEPDTPMRPPTQEEYEQAAHAREMAEESRRHALYQSYASYGSEHPPETYGAEETGDDYYRGGYANQQSDQHGGGPSPTREAQPKWASERQQRPPPQGASSSGAPHPQQTYYPQQSQQPHPHQQQTYQQQTYQRPHTDGPPQMPQQPHERAPGSPSGYTPRGTPRGADSPIDRVPPGERHRRQQVRPPPSPGGGGGGGYDSARGRPDSGRSGFTPSLFEKGSFAESKIRDVQRAGSGDTPLSGRGSDRSARGGAYADFAARMRGAESNRSERSARGSSRPW